MNRLDWSEARARDIIARHQTREGALLPILHDLQDAFGCVPEAATPLIAQMPNLSRAEVHGVITFYHDFRREKPGRSVLKLCRAEACQSVGGEDVAAAVQERLGIGFGETTPDGQVTLDAVYCLGLCACAPAAMWNGDVIGRVESRTIHALLDGKR